MELPILYLIIPCYNEQAVLPFTAPQFLKKLTDLTAAGKIASDSRVLFVDDGSKDATWDIPLFFHSRTSENGAANQFIGRAFAHVKVKRMIAVDNLLVDFFANLTNPARCQRCVEIYQNARCTGR